MRDLVDDNGENQNDDGKDEIDKHRRKLKVLKVYKAKSFMDFGLYRLYDFPMIPYFNYGQDMRHHWKIIPHGWRIFKPHSGNPVQSDGYETTLRQSSEKEDLYS